MLAVLLVHLLSFLYTAVWSPIECQDKPSERYASGNNSDYDEAVKFLWENDALTAAMFQEGSSVYWNDAVGLRKENERSTLDITLDESKLQLETWKNASSFAWKNFREKNETVYRWFKKLSVLGTNALPEDKLRRHYKVMGDMWQIYYRAKVCSKDSPTDKPCDLSLEPEITELFQKSRDYDELKQLWSDYRDATGRKIKPLFVEYVNLTNEAAELNGFDDAGEMWRDAYETETFEEDVEELWKTVEPLYKQLHAYVRRKLIEQYPNKGISPDGPIPAHLFGDMWSQSWVHIFSIVKPFQGKGFVDVTKRLIQNKTTPLDMFKIADEFFTSLGLEPMTEEFWNHSVIEKPEDIAIDCHPSAWNFFRKTDFRIKMCTRVDMENFVNIHHEMGHIQYHMQYAHQPIVFREGANPGFHEAVGDTVALSVVSSNHLKKIGLMEDRDEDNETEINGLMLRALERVAFLPFAYTVDSWRWKVFSGEFPVEELNSKWWYERLKYQGICPPVRRTNDDLDAASKYHVVVNVPFIRYFVSYIMQFQFHKALCDAAGYKGPLHKCDIYGNKDAGKLLSDVLSLGSSLHWMDVMKIMTRGQTNKMDTQPLIDYFEPLTKWLKKQNEGEIIGWKSLDPMMCPQVSS